MSCAKSHTLPAVVIKSFYSSTLLKPYNDLISMAGNLWLFAQDIKSDALEL